MLALIGGLGIVLSAHSARADGQTRERPVGGSPHVSDDGPTAGQRWYGYQTVISDFLSTSLFFAGASTFELCFNIGLGPRRSCNNDGSGMLLLAGMTGYTFGGPVIHAAHGHWDKAGYSLGLRVGSVAAAVGVASAIDDPGVRPLLYIGAPLVAMILDAGLFGYETVPAGTMAVSLAPSYDPKSRTGSLGVAGIF